MMTSPGMMTDVHRLIYLLILSTTCLHTAYTFSLPVRIVGGMAVTPGAHPWQVSIQKLSRHHCGGSLVAPGWVITAASCITTIKSLYSVVIGMHDRINQNQGDAKIYQVKEIYIHPNYRYNGYEGYPNNVALLELDQDADIGSQYVQSVQLPSPDYRDYSNCYIGGWGAVTGKTKSPQIALADILQTARVDIITNSQCYDQWQPYSTIQTYHICIAPKGPAPCTHDSGSPLVCKTGDTSYLVGTFSWGRSDCDTTHPAVYSRITNYIEWIKTVTGIVGV